MGNSLPLDGRALKLSPRTGHYVAVNASENPDDRGLNHRRPVGFSGVAGVYSDYTKVTVGAHGSPTYRPLALFHELAENYHQGFAEISGVRGAE